MSSHYGYSPYLWLPLAAGGLFAALAIYASRRRSVPGAVPFAIAMAFALPFAAGAALAGAAVDPSTKIIWTEFQMIWLLPAVTAELCFLLEYASLGRWLTRRNLILLAVPPCVFAGLAMTNHLHHLLWAGFLLERYVHPVRSWGGWAFTAYGYVIVLASAIVLIQLFISSPRHRFPAALCLFGQFVGRSIFLIEAAHVNPVAPMDIVVFGKVFTATCYALALFQFRMFQLIPVARGILIEQMGEGVVVVDTEQHIVDINPAAERILRIPAQRARGSNAVDVLPQLAACLRHPTVADLPIAVELAESPQRYTLKVSPLKHRRGFRLGWLLLLQDVTAEEQANAKLLEQQRAMAALHERVVIARELHDSFGQVLGYVKMQGQAVRDSLARGKKQEADRLLGQLVAVTEETHADVRDYIIGAKTAAPMPIGLLPSLLQYLAHFTEHYGIHTELHIATGIPDGVFAPTVEVQLLRIVQEALTNARKHARAERVRVSFRFEDSKAEVLVEDDGVGFAADRSATQTLADHFGLKFMRERAEGIAGSVDVQSAPGRGTRVTVRVPVNHQPNPQAGVKHEGSAGR